MATLTVKNINPLRLDELNSGRAETTVLTEGLAIDFAKLMHAALPELKNATINLMQDEGNKLGIAKRMVLAGELIYQDLGADALSKLQKHTSDTVRGWGCFVISSVPALSLEERLKQIKPFADDSHFGVREWAWMAVRPYLTDDLQKTIELLQAWTESTSERVRRFATESIRPRGVWCAHIQSLKDTPEQALSLLEALKADESRYVQDSVANWLNDASKSQPDWVAAVCERWLKEDLTHGEVGRICKRAMRSIK